MPQFHFHIDDGTQITDRTGTFLADLKAARSEAIMAAGAILNEIDGEFWGHEKPWVMHVTDEEHRLLFSLHFSAEVPSGEVLFRPEGLKRD